MGAAGAGSGTGAGTRSRVTGALLASLGLAGAEFSLTAGLILALGAEMAAIGVIRIANDRRQATNTLALPGIDSGVAFLTVIYSENERVGSELFFDNVGAVKKPVYRRQA